MTKRYLALDRRTRSRPVLRVLSDSQLPTGRGDVVTVGAYFS